MGIKKITIEFDEDWQAPYNLITPQRSNPCANCNNNPANNPLATGVCNCVWPYITNTYY